MKTITYTALSLLAFLLLLGCTPSTPQTRIERSPTVYENLSKRDRQLAAQGQVARGMSREAVYIAWGNPSSQSVGERDGQPSERWDYLGSRPNYRTFISGWGGYGWGRHNRYRGGIGISPVVTYVPYRKGTVWFKNGKVTEWEKVAR